MICVLLSSTFPFKVSTCAERALSSAPCCSREVASGEISMAFMEPSRVVIDSTIPVPLASISALTSSLNVEMLVVIVVWLISIWLAREVTFSFVPSAFAALVSINARTALTSSRTAESGSSSLDRRAVAPAPAAPPTARAPIAEARFE